MFQHRASRPHHQRDSPPYRCRTWSSRARSPLRSTPWKARSITSLVGRSPLILPIATSSILTLLPLLHPLLSTPSVAKSFVHLLLHLLLPFHLLEQQQRQNHHLHPPVLLFRSRRRRLISKMKTRKTSLPPCFKGKSPNKQQPKPTPLQTNLSIPQTLRVSSRSTHLHHHHLLLHHKLKLILALRPAFPVCPSPHQNKALLLHPSLPDPSQEVLPLSPKTDGPSLTLIHLPHPLLLLLL